MPVQNWNDIQVSQLAAAQRKLGIVAGGGIALQASGTSVAGTGTVQLANANGVTFGLAGNTITASVLAAASAGIGAVAGSAASSVTSGTLVFANANGLSFGLAGSTMTASHNALTTAAASDHSHGALALTNLTGTSASNGLSLSAGAPGAGGLGGIADGVSSVTNGTVVFANSNGMTFGLNGSTMTAVHNGITTAALVTHTHGNLALTNLSGTSASSGLSLSAAAPGMGGGLAALADGAASSVTSGTIVFANLNGISFGYNGSTMTASHNAITTAAASDHTHGNLALTNLTGTSASNGLSLSAAAAGTGGGVSINGSTGAISISGSALASISNNVSTVIVSVRSISLDEVQDPASDKVFNMGTRALQFQYAGGGSFSTNATRQALFEIDAAGNLTDGADIVHIHQSVANPVIDLLHLQGAGTGVTLLRMDAVASIAAEINAPLKFTSGSVPLVLGTSQSNLVANLNADYLDGTHGSDYGARTHTHGALALTNLTGTSASNGLSLSVDAPGGAGIGGIAGSGTLTVTSGTVYFSNSNDITFGLAGSTITASRLGPTNLIAGTYSFTDGSVHFSGSTNLTVQRAGNSILFSVSDVPLIAVSNTTYNTAGTIIMTGTNNITVTYAGNSIRVSGPPVVTLIASDSTFSTGGNVYLVGSGNCTVNYAGSSIRVSVSNQAGIAGIAGSGASTVTNGTLQFSNLNGISFGLNGSTMTASHNALTTAAQVSHSHGNPTLALTNLTGTTASNSNGLTLSISAANPAAGIAGIAGNAASTVTGGTVQFSNANNVSFGLNGSTMTASIDPTAGLVPVVSEWPLIGYAGCGLTTILDGGTSGATGGSTQFSGSGRIYRVGMPFELKFDNINAIVSALSTNQTGSASVGYLFGIYTLAGNSALSLLSSFHWGMVMSQNSATARTHHWWFGSDSNANSSSLSGNVAGSFTSLRQIALWAGTSLSLADGDYYFAHMLTQRTSSRSVFQLASQFIFSGSQTTYASMMGLSDLSQAYQRDWAGIFSTTTNTNVILHGLLMPGSIHTSAITQTGGSSQILQPVVWFHRRTT